MSKFASNERQNSLVFKLKNGIKRSGSIQNLQSDVFHRNMNGNKDEEILGHSI